MPVNCAVEFLNAWPVLVLLRVVVNAIQRFPSAHIEAFDYANMCGKCKQSPRETDMLVTLALQAFIAVRGLDALCHAFSRHPTGTHPGLASQAEARQDRARR
jgi:hypothetical protein